MKAYSNSKPAFRMVALNLSETPPCVINMGDAQGYTCILKPSVVRYPNYKVFNF